MAKINLKRGLTDIVLYMIIFIVVQIIVMYAGAGIWAGIKGEGYQATLLAVSSGSNPILMALTSAFSNVITLVIFLKTKWTPLTRDYLLSKPWGTLLWVALFSLGTIIPLSFLYEQLGIEMDENTQQIFTSLMKEPWGYVAVGILAPLAEEVVFRGAVLRTLLGLMSKKNHWVAIMISAAICNTCIQHLKLCFTDIDRNSTQIINPTFDRALIAVRLRASGVTDSHGVTGGVYKARERIHRGILIRDY